MGGGGASYIDISFTRVLSVPSHFPESIDQRREGLWRMVTLSVMLTLSPYRHPHWMGGKGRRGSRTSLTRSLAGPAAADQ